MYTVYMNGKVGLMGAAKRRAGNTFWKHMGSLVVWSIYFGHAGAVRMEANCVHKTVQRESYVDQSRKRLMWVAALRPW
jgi:uncharacterized membrane protein YsdA (DUF1294 family)